MKDAEIIQYDDGSDYIPTVIVGERGNPFIDRMNALAGQGLTMGEAMTQVLRDMVAEGHPLPSITKRGITS